MNLYLVALATHVVVAILGLGSVVSVALIAAMVRRSGRGAAEAAGWIRPLLRVGAFSLAGMRPCAHRRFSLPHHRAAATTSQSPSRS